MTDTVPRFEDLSIKIFADGADLDSIFAAYENKWVRGFTTNPTLMAKAGITNYLRFAREVLRVITDLPVSFEVFADDIESMRRQAGILADLAPNVYVKIPVTNTQGVPCAPLVKDLAAAGLKLNITALFTETQIIDIANALHPDVPAIVSVFAGRIADSGRDPIPHMQRALEILRPLPQAELLWASPREPLNILQADAIGCHIITVTPEFIEKAKNFGKTLEQFSLETVQMFYRDAQRSGFTL